MIPYKSALWVFIFALVVAALPAAPAGAVAFDWDFASTYLAPGSPGGSTYGNSLWFSATNSSSEVVKVRAYAPSGTNGVFQTAYVGRYSGGLGVSNRTEGGPPA